MAIQTSIINILNGTNNGGAVLYELKEFLVNSANWTVAGSSDGTTGGMDAVDRIVDRDSISSTNDWVVLQSPHVNAADRIQILFGKSLTSATNGRFRYNPQADWATAAPSTDPPTSAYESADTIASNVTTTSDVRMHMLADDADPYGFAAYLVRISDQTTYFAIALVPLAYGTATSPGKPYVFATESNFDQTSIATVDGGKVAEPAGPPQIPVSTAPATLNNSAGTLVPNGTPQTSDNRDQSSPTIFHSLTTHFGVSTFMLWNGSPRNDFDTLEDGTGARGRIVFGDVNFPWDGVTVPNTTTSL